MDYIINKNGQQIFVENFDKKNKSMLFKQFKSKRKDLGITQVEIAALAGMNRTDVSRFESGKYNPSLDLMLRYANALGCKLEINLVPDIENNISEKVSDDN